MERIPASNYQQYTGHCDRYRWAADKILPGEVVNDVACGVGYGSEFLGHAVYRGYDRPGVPDQSFSSGTSRSSGFFAADLDDPQWWPEMADVTICFETLEHVTYPAHLAEVLMRTTRRAILVSVPVVPTTHMNGHHLHDFIQDDIPGIFPGFTVVEEWPQPEELSHVWMLGRLLSTGHGAAFDSSVVIGPVQS